MSFYASQGRSNYRVFERISKHKQISERAIRLGMMDTGRDLVKTGRELIRKGPKTGRLYRIPGRKRRHRASAPGEAPANLTGKLARSQGYKVVGHSKMYYGEREPYAPYLELGTPFMEPRPHLIKSIRLNKKNSRNNFEVRLMEEHKR